MKNYIALLLGFTSFVCFANEEASKLIALHDDITRAYMVEGNVEPLDNSTSEEYILVAGIGLLEHKDHVLKTSGNLDVTAVTFTNDYITFKDNTAILSGVIAPDGTIMGHQLPKFRYLSIFIKEQGSWKLQARSITPIRKPPVKN